MSSTAVGSKRLSRRFHRAALASFWLLAGVPAAFGLTVVSEGRSEFSIVVPEPATATVTYAADELQEYLRRITGVELRIVAESAAPAPPRIFVGPCKAAADAGIEPPAAECFVVRVIDRDLFIVGGGGGPDPLRTFGGSVTGTAYGVFELLRRHGGVRWLWPGELGTVVPKSSEFIVPDDVNVRDGPDFRIRNLWLTYRNPPAVAREYAAWYRHTGQGQSVQGHSGHAYSRLLARNKHFEAHPEYHAFSRGKRRPFYGKGLRAGQICTSNPEVVFLAAQNALTDPRRIVSLSPNDGSGFCECEKCRALDEPENTMQWQGGPIPALTDRIFTFVNGVAELIHDEAPDKLCGHYCYTFFKRPPMRVADLSDNVVLFFAQACHWFRDPAVRSRYRGYIDAWAKYGNPMVSREYYGLIYWHGLPNIHTRMIEEDVKYLKRKGFIGVNSEMCRDFATHGPNYYLAARLLWDAEGARDEILSDYYRAGFGPAAADVAEYFDVFERRLAALGAGASGVGSRNINNLPKQFDADTVAAARRAFDRASAKANAPEVRARLDFIRIGLDYTDVTSRLIALLQQLNACGMSMYPLTAADLTRPPTAQEYAAMVKEARELDERRWRIVASQGALPALHTPALEEQRGRGRWGEQLRRQYEILADEAGRYLALPLVWRFRTEKPGDDARAGWEQPGFEDDGWATIETNKPWEKQGYPEFDGIAWYRVGVDVPEDRADSERVILRLGAVDESCWAWLNGEKIGEFFFDVEKDASSWRKPLDFDVTGKLSPGRNVIALRVRDVSGLGGLWKPSYLVFDRETPNLLKNGSFEQGAAAWSLRGAAGAGHRLVDTAGFESTHCLTVRVPAGPKVHWQAAQTAAVGGDARCAFSFRYRTKAVGEHPTIKRTPAIRVIFRGADGKSLTGPKGYFWGGIKVPSDTADWQEGTLFFRTLPDTAGVSVTLFLHRPGTYWLDAFKLRQLK